ncbi:MAG: MobA/MobL family protein [Oscillospiraceae bacterium]|nr:MobA/MobL family protein [Oscillospiraceae bacterium]
MAIYHLSVKYISRNQGRSAVGAAAYRAGDKLHSSYDGQSHDYTNKTGITHTEIILPHNAPHEFYNRQTLWNAVEAAEKRKDGRTAREIEIALPCELSKDEQIKLVREYVNNNFVNRGMCADVAIHSGHRHKKDEQNIEAQNDKNIFPNNPHAHILLTTRPVNQQGFERTKNRNWNNSQNVHEWRKQWANIQNKELERKGLEKVSHESNAKRGIDREPTIHMGQNATAQERRGIRTDRGDINREIKARNQEREQRQQRRQQEREQSRSRNRSKSQDLSR